MRCKHFRAGAYEWLDNFNFGGATVMWDDNHAGVSFCSNKDQYSKKRGRMVAKGRYYIAKAMAIVQAETFGLFCHF